GALDQRFATEVREARVRVWLGDADVNDAPDPAPTRGLEELPAVVHRAFVADAPIPEADPVGVVEDLRSRHRSGHGHRVVEGVGDRPNLGGEAREPIRMPGQRRHGTTALDEPGGDIPPEVPAGSGDNVGLHARIIRTYG